MEALKVAPPAGLTTAEAAARRRAGEANTPVDSTSRSYSTILRTNVFSFYNSIIFVIGAALLAMGRYNDAFVSVGLGLVNAVISAAQEIGAKRKLDGLQLLDAAQVVVVRDGAEVAVAPAEVVRGDVVRVRPGDQIVLDGPLLPHRARLHPRRGADRAPGRAGAAGQRRRVAHPRRRRLHRQDGHAHHRT